MALTAAVISGISMLVAGASLAWNIASWIGSGQRIKFHIMLRGSDGHQIIDVHPKNYGKIQGLFHPGGFKLLAVVFQVHNKGRIAATIADCFLVCGLQHVALHGGAGPGGKSLPHRIDPFDKATFVFPLAHFASAVQEEYKIRAIVRAGLELATGKRLKVRGKPLTLTVYGTEDQPDYPGRQGHTHSEVLIDEHGHPHIACETPKPDNVDESKDPQVG